MTFPLIFVFCCIKQKWSKIQFYLLEHIFVVRFVHFPIDISDIYGGKSRKFALWRKKKILSIIEKA